MSDRNPDESDRRDTADREPTDPTDRDPAERETTAQADHGVDETRRAEAEPRRSEVEASSDGDPDDPDRGEDDDGGAGLSGGIALLVAAAVALVVTAVAYVWVGGWAGNEIFFENLFRVAPTVEGGGVGADWVFGNTVPLLDALIAIVHAADVLMGVAILAILFIHWAIFRRLADRMQRPVGAESRGTVATDGGEHTATSRGEQGGDGR